MPATISGGEAQRVAIARAIANRPRIVLADEPTAALDSQRAGIVMDLMSQVATEQKAAIIVVSHDEKIFNRFHRIFHLRDGQARAYPVKWRLGQQLTRRCPRQSTRLSTVGGRYLLPIHTSA